MANLPFRGLAERGILRDPAPYQLDLNAWSAGSNMRFHTNKAMRSPVFRQVGASAGFTPQHIVGYRPSTGFDQVFLFDTGGHQYRLSGGFISDIAPAGYVPTSTSSAFTTAFLGDVQYSNRFSDVPYYFGPASTKFAALPNWDPTWRCRSLRSFGSYLVAMNVTKGNSTVKTMVKWSDLTLAGQVPGSWDSNNPANNAGEDVLEGLDTALVDGCTMRSVFVLYSSKHIVAMAQTPTNEVFTFRTLFSEGGLIAPNCVVEVDGKHYVFGPDDIYVHDGVTKQSIVDQRNRDFIYRNLDAKASDVCFAHYSPSLNEIVFGYKSGDASSPFQGGAWCNKGAVYNIPGNTWSFIELPNVGGMSLANLNTGLSYASAAVSDPGLTFANVGGSYYDQDSGYGQHIIAVSAVGGPITINRVLAYDFMNKGKLSAPFIAECNSSAYLERTGLDLDQLGSDLATYKNMRRVFPLVSIFDNVPVQVQIGGALTPSGDVLWGPKVPFNPKTQYKIDAQRGGRYLAVRFTVDTPCDFEVQGFDVDVASGGKR